MEELSRWKRRWERERAARKKAEEILEDKALQLYMANQELVKLNESLEATILERTKNLKQNQQRLSGLIASLDGGILLIDEHQKVILVNKRFCELFCLENGGEDLIGLNSLEVHHRIGTQFSNIDDFIVRLTSIVTNKEQVINEVLKTTNGVVLERDYIPITKDAEYSGHLWHYRDVTDRFNTEIKIKASEEKYRGIIDNMNLGILEVDNDGIVLKASDLFCEMVGYQREELEGINPEKLLLPPKYQPVLKEHSASRLQGVSDVYEIQIRRKDGELVWLQVSGAPFFGMDGKVKGSIGLHHDITEKKHMHEDLVAAKIRAEEAQKAEKEFLAHMSHEIRTPLNAIIGMSHLLYDTKPTNQQKVYLDTLRNAATILHRLINDILDFSKIEAGAIEVSREPFDLKGMVTAMQQTFEVKLETSEVRFICKFDPQIEYMVIGDELLLQRVLLNLIGNATKFTEFGSITLEVTLEEQFSNDLLISFKVRDTGIGIAEDKLDYIFQDFKQADRSTSIKYGGTGLGLAITKQLVDLMEGLIFVESEVGKGTCFTVELPFKYTDVKPSISGKNVVNEGNLSKNSTVLIVEDNEMNRAYIGGLLRKWGVKFELAKDGVEALDKTKSDIYDLIIMDIRMPRMNGYDATINIRSQESNKNQHTPIVALTASAMESEKSKALEIGMNDFLTKPFAPDQLKKLLSDYLPLNQFEEIEDVEQEVYHHELDIKYLKSFYEDDYESALEMFEMFLDQIVPEIKEMSPLIETESWSQLRALVHKVKPTFSMVGITGMTEKCSKIEGLLDAGKTAVAKPLVYEVLEAYEKYLPYLVEQITMINRTLETV